MALQEYYNTNDDGTKAFGTVRWYSQSFTPVQDYDITSVKLKLYRSTGQSPGAATVNIETIVADDPDGVVLCTGTTNTNTLTENTAGEWREITFSSPASLTNGTEYAIVVKALDAAGNHLNWRVDNSSPTYAGGTSRYTLNSGVDWTTIASDHMFEVYGDATTYSELAGTIASTSTVSGNLDTTAISQLAGTIAATSTVSGNLGSTTVGIDVQTSFIKRLIVAGKDRIYFEDI